MDHKESFRLVNKLFSIWQLVVIFLSEIEKNKIEIKSYWENSFKIVKCDDQNLQIGLNKFRWIILLLSLK